MKIPLILIPGLLCDHSLWSHQVGFLSRVADCTITDRHMHRDSIGDIAEAIVAEAPARFALAGLSMGGYIALEICRQFGERVDRLALLDTSARADTPAQTVRRESLMARCRDGQFRSVPETLYPLMVHSDRLTDETLKAQIVGMALRAGPEVFVRQEQAIIDRIDQVPNLSKISCPTIVICGEQDQLTPLECAEEMALNIRQAELVVVRNCGHMSTMEKPAEVSSVLYDWLAKEN